MGAIPERTIAEIVKEYDIPSGFEGIVKFIQDQTAEMLAKSGMSAEDAKTKADRLGAALVRPDLLPEGASEKLYAGRNEYDEKRLLGDISRLMADPTGQKRIRLIDVEKTFKSMNEAIGRGAFGLTVDKLVTEGKLASKTISDASHAAAVFTAFSQDYIEKRYLLSRFPAEFAENFPMTAAMQKFPKMPGDDPTVAKHTRGTEETASVPELTTVTLTANELFGSYVVPNETLRDASGKLMEVLLKRIGVQMRRQQLIQYATGAGTGSGEPLGIENGTYSKEVAVNGGITWRHLVQALNTLGDEWTMAPADDGLCWVMNQATKEVCQLMEDDSGRPIFMRLETTAQTGLITPAQNSQPQFFTMLGIPGIVLPGLTGTATVSNPASIYLGAWKSAYYVGLREDFNLFVSEHVEAKRNSTYIRGTMGHDGQVAQADGVCVISGIEGAG